MTTKTIVASAITLAFVSASSFAQAKPMNCAAVTTKQVESLFDRWNASLATLDPAKVTANYAPDAVLLPTVSNTPRTNSAEIQDYFVDFLKKHPQGKINSRTIRISCNKASDVGIYTFTLSGDSPSEKQIVKARYSFIYAYRDNKWLISHHHSSAMPEPVKPASAAAAPK